VQVHPDPSSFRAACDEARHKGLTVGLVPTMGALHDGHLSLLRAARKEVDFVVVSLFVNPTQFGPNEDFLRYPRPLERDLWLLQESEAAAVLTPTPEAMYPDGDRTRVRVSGLTDGLCSPFRPGHFEGVATVVAKLLHIAGPCKAFFGRKDYQQLQVVRRSVKDLFLPATIVGVPTVREVDGLARSSRNIYLTVEQRDAALSLVTGLRAAHDAFVAGERDAAVLRALAHEPVSALATRIDYVEVADADDLTPTPAGQRVGARALVAIAAWIGTTRLIDNVVLGEDPRP
jgi:pantoate--beta-alanine ligase